LKILACDGKTLPTSNARSETSASLHSKKNPVMAKVQQSEKKYFFVEMTTV
jgi:hypothetical protein